MTTPHDLTPADCTRCGAQFVARRGTLCSECRERASGAYEPEPEEIARATREIQERWTERERAKRHHGTFPEPVETPIVSTEFLRGRE